MHKYCNVLKSKNCLYFNLVIHMIRFKQKYFKNKMQHNFSVQNSKIVAICPYDIFKNIWIMSTSKRQVNISNSLKCLAGQTISLFGRNRITQQIPPCRLHLIMTCPVTHKLPFWTQSSLDFPHQHWPSRNSKYKASQNRNSLWFL